MSDVNGWVDGWVSGVDEWVAGGWLIVEWMIVLMSLIVEWMIDVLNEVIEWQMTGFQCYTLRQKPTTNMPLVLQHVGQSQDLHVLLAHWVQPGMPQGGYLLTGVH